MRGLLYSENTRKQLELLHLLHTAGFSLSLSLGQSTTALNVTVSAAYNSGKPGNLREFVNSGKVREI